MEKSLKSYSLLLVAPFACLATVPAFAQTPAPSITMEVVEEGETVEELFERIELPAEASDQARESSQRGLDTANAARAGGREFGQARAEEARQRGGAEASENAEQARANARDQMGDSISRGEFDDLPAQARENIPERARERIRNRGRGGN